MYFAWLYLERVLLSIDNLKYLLFCNKLQANFNYPLQVIKKTCILNSSSTFLIVAAYISLLGLCNFLLFLQALDTFNLAIVSPIYYVMFTTLTIVASGIMFKVQTSPICLVN